MAQVPAQMVREQFLTTTAATIYTAPGTTASWSILRNIHINNEAGSAVVVTLSVAATATADAAGKRFLGPNFSIPANGSYDWSGMHVLKGTDLLIGFAGSASSLTISVSGIEGP